MFPIIDVRGDVIGFGGRVMDDSTPKYLNSPDTPVYNKSRNIFALNVAKKSKAGRVILTEGYMDTIALHQAGFDSAVASLGTALTPEHAQLLSRYFPQAIIAYDGDGAGRRRRPAGHSPAGEGGAEGAGAADPGGQGPGRVYQNLRSGGLRPTAGPEREPGGLPPGPAKAEVRPEGRRPEGGLPAGGRPAAVHPAQCGGAGDLRRPRRPDGGGLPGGHGPGGEESLSAAAAEGEKEAGAAGPGSRRQPAAQAPGLRYENIRSALAEEGVIRLLLLDPGLYRGYGGPDRRRSSPLPCWAGCLAF